MIASFILVGVMCFIAGFFVCLIGHSSMLAEQLQHANSVIKETESYMHSHKSPAVEIYTNAVIKGYREKWYEEQTSELV